MREKQFYVPSWAPYKSAALIFMIVFVGKTWIQEKGISFMEDHFFMQPPFLLGMFAVSKCFILYN